MIRFVMKSQIFFFVFMKIFLCIVYLLMVYLFCLVFSCFIEKKKKLFFVLLDLNYVLLLKWKTFFKKSEKSLEIVFNFYIYSVHHYLNVIETLFL